MFTVIRIIFIISHIIPIMFLYKNDSSVYSCQMFEDRFIIDYNACQMFEDRFIIDYNA